MPHVEEKGLLPGRESIPRIHASQLQENLRILRGRQTLRRLAQRLQSLWVTWLLRIIARLPSLHGAKLPKIVRILRNRRRCGKQDAKEETEEEAKRLDDEATRIRMPLRNRRMRLVERTIRGHVRLESGGGPERTQNGAQRDPEVPPPGTHVRRLLRNTMATMAAHTSGRRVPERSNVFTFLVPNVGGKVERADESNPPRR